MGDLDRIQLFILRRVVTTGAAMPRAVGTLKAAVRATIAMGTEQGMAAVVAATVTQGVVGTALAIVMATGGETVTVAHVKDMAGHATTTEGLETATAAIMIEAAPMIEEAHAIHTAAIGETDPHAMDMADMSAKGRGMVDMVAVEAADMVAEAVGMAAEVVGMAAMAELHKAAVAMPDTKGISR